MAGLFVAMKGRFVTAVIFLLILCLIFGSCCNGFLLDEIELPKQTVRTFTIYLSGAVERDGYYKVQSGTTYYELFQLAGVLDETVLPSFCSNLIDSSTSFVWLDFYDGQQHLNSVNVNGKLIEYRLEIDGISPDVVNKIADYIEQNGKVHNRQQLRNALGSDYEDNYYKFYITQDDYEKVD